MPTADYQLLLTAAANGLRPSAGSPARGRQRRQAAIPPQAARTAPVTALGHWQPLKISIGPPPEPRGLRPAARRRRRDGEALPEGSGRRASRSRLRP